jgi:hypothetical protein
MAQMTPVVRASGQGGIVISCADPRVPCDQILGFDEIISNLSDDTPNLILILSDMLAQIQL